MKPSRARKPLRPLDEALLNELALRYVGRFATTRAKLRSYLTRKVRERGWSGAGEPDLGSIAERFADLGYIDDASYALSKSQSLTARGDGKKRVVQALKIAGIGEEDSSTARDHAEVEAVTAAVRFARRRRIGPFAQIPPANPRERDKALAAMMRAGHGFELSRAILALPPGEEVDVDQLNR
jgi:regulatory protein